MKNSKIILFATFFAIIALMAGCTKDEEPTPEPDPVTPAKQSDQAGSAEVDEALDNVNDLINNKIGGGSTARMAAYNLPCGVVSVDSSTSSGGHTIYKLNYGNQTACGYKYKSGLISFSLQNASTFNQAGAIFITTFTNYKVEVLATGSVVTLNGSIYVTNVTGGFVWEAVTSSATITHKIRGTLNITYANGVTRPRSYFQQRTWTSASGWAGLSLTIAGDTTINSVTGISETGKTYDGNYDFVTELITNFVWANCGTTWAGPYLLKSGQAKMDVTVPLITPTYIEVEAGYDWDYLNAGSTPVLVNDCTSNSYKITTVIGTTTVSSYQLY